MLYFRNIGEAVEFLLRAAVYNAGTSGSNPLIGTHQDTVLLNQMNHPKIGRRSSVSDNWSILASM